MNDRRIMLFLIGLAAGFCVAMFFVRSAGGDSGTVIARARTDDMESAKAVASARGSAARSGSRRWRGSARTPGLRFSTSGRPDGCGASSLIDRVIFEPAHGGAGAREGAAV
jgi:hypothetical protein